MKERSIARCSQSPPGAGAQVRSGFWHPSRIKAQVYALEDGLEPQLVGERIRELRADRQALEAALAEMAPNRDDTEDDVLAECLSRLPDLSQAFRDAPFALKSDARGLRP